MKMMGLPNRYILAVMLFLGVWATSWSQDTPSDCYRGTFQWSDGATFQVRLQIFQLMRQGSDFEFKGEIRYTEDTLMQVSGKIMPQAGLFVMRELSSNHPAAILNGIHRGVITDDLATILATWYTDDHGPMAGSTGKLRLRSCHSEKPPQEL